MAITLDEIKASMSTIDAKYLKYKKINQGFEYYKKERKTGNIISIAVTYSDYRDSFIFDGCGINFYYKAIDGYLDSYYIKYGFYGGPSTSTFWVLLKYENIPMIGHSQMTEINDSKDLVEYKQEFQRLINNNFHLIEKYSNLENVAEVIVNQPKGVFPIKGLYFTGGLFVKPIFILKYLNHPLYLEKLAEYVEKQIKIIVEDGVDVYKKLRMFEEIFHEDLQKIGYEFEHDFLKNK